MTQQHPITPPPELVEQWMQVHTTKYDLARQAAQWGADQELEACCEWLFKDPATHDLVGREARYLDFELRAARRPKPPSLKRVALLQLDTLNADLGLEGKGVDLSQIRRALEQLPDN